ncbi:glycosyltransferase [Microtetraspora sp. AC03309]|uniref:glycosyltransferase n=1 Tax=Microtetraspora sp. AC03309 TaxID=2779376 RepID=UPI001E2CB895|nr:glycosyltransferase [Microtetraspora sp. AC03309]
MTGDETRPRIRHNDYSPLTPAPIGRWRPELPVSVIIPAHGGQHRLDLALASLAAQTYPAHLTEVVIVDDGSSPPLRLPEIRPENTRMIATTDGWGPGRAFNTGVAATEGTVVQRLDADMVVHREHLEALLRWHHLTDYLVTIGAKRFIEEPPVTAAEVHQAVAGGTLKRLFDPDKAIPSTTEMTILRLDGLRSSKNPYHVCTGPTLSLYRTLFREIGGFDQEVQRGEDTELGYRLAQAGAVFVPDLEARAVHLGLPAQRRDRGATVRAVEPYLAHRVPLRRDLRKERGRRWRVPYVEVVLRVAEAGERKTRAAVNAALDGTLPDVAVTLVAPWSALPTGRHSVLEAPGFELRMIREGFHDDPRVRLAEDVTPSAAPVPFRYSGPVDVPPAPATLERMVKALLDERLGLLVVDFPDGRTATLERTEAVGRARLLAAPGEPLADVIHQTHGVRHSPAGDFWPSPAGRPAVTPAPSQAPSGEGRPLDGRSSAASPSETGGSQPAESRPGSQPESRPGSGSEPRAGTALSAETRSAMTGLTQAWTPGGARRERSWIQRVRTALRSRYL